MNHNQAIELERIVDVYMTAIGPVWVAILMLIIFPPILLMWR